MGAGFTPRPDDLTIRTAAPEDMEGVRDVTVAAYDQYRRAMSGPAWEQYKGNILRALKESDRALCAVAVRNGSVVGSVWLFPPTSDLARPYPEVRLLAVQPEARGGGIGLKLMQECIRRARATGALALSLHTTLMMESALRMYERMGFHRTPETDFHPIADVTVMGFALDLAQASD